MSRDFKFVLNRAGVRELMQSEEMQDVLLDHAKSIATRAGEGYDVFVGKTRANVSVYTATESAMKDNLDNNTLEKAVRS